MYMVEIHFAARTATVGIASSASLPAANLELRSQEATLQSLPPPVSAEAIIDGSILVKVWPLACSLGVRAQTEPPKRSYATTYSIT